MNTQKPQVLIADDDADLIEALGWYLEAEGFQVESVNSGDAALEAFRRLKPDVVILDIMMPGMDGVKVCEAIRKESDAFVMMLSAKDTELDKVRALTTGADDYVTKPFHTRELLARIHALLRRPRSGEAPKINLQWGNLKVMLDERRVLVNGADVPLTQTEFSLLAELMTRPGVVISREDMVQAIWKEELYDGQRIVDTHVYRLREKLVHAGLEKPPIVTVRGIGYAFRPED